MSSLEWNRIELKFNGLSKNRNGALKPLFSFKDEYGNEGNDQHES